MNNDTLEGQARDIGGRVKETTGTLTNDPALRSEGVADQGLARRGQPRGVGHEVHVDAAHHHHGGRSLC